MGGLLLQQAFAFFFFLVHAGSFQLRSFEVLSSYPLCQLIIQALKNVL